MLAIVAGVIIHYAYIKIKPKPKIDNKTIPITKAVLARLVLPNNTEIKILENETIFGRFNFVGAISADDLQFIGREHFKIMKMDDGVYIEDLDSVNGTKLNGEEIKGDGRKELKDGDKILVADVLKMRYAHVQE
jgi:pSer/pThr/pTyr-binding forkhead associated (FHA) protein